MSNRKPLYADFDFDTGEPTLLKSDMKTPATAQPGGSGGSVTVVNDLVTGGTTAALSAEQGKTLKTQLDAKAGAFVAPVAVAAPLVLADAHQGAVLVCTGTPALTINNGMTAGFGVTLEGVFSYGGTATVTDKRKTGDADPLCSLVNVGVNAYVLRGSKP